MRVYPVDLREKIVAAVRRGMSKAQVAHIFEVEATSVKRYVKPVIMDNLSAHKGERVKNLIESRSCELLYLPSYSPDLNPIEEAFSKIKGTVRKVRARGREALVVALGISLDALSAEDASSFFEHCGLRCNVIG